jgi:DNA-3-methyladenine glycosylase II
VPRVAQPVLTARRLRTAAAALSAADPRLAAIIEQVGPCTLRPEREGSHLDAIVRSIVYQQLSGAAAATIHARVLAQCGAGGRLTADRLATIDPAALRAAGLSTAKSAAVQDLARHVVDGRLPVEALDEMPDDEVIASLVQVRGIGPWTAQMFLMFRLGRPDVLPVLDLGVRKGAQRIHRLRTLPDADRLERLARPWQPWRSVASWYCWRALEL